MSASSKKPGRKWEAAISALLAHNTIGEAARACGMGESTLRRWLKEDYSFKVAYRRAKEELLASVASQLRSAMGKAAGVLMDVACDPYSSPAVRVAAATRILELGVKHHKADIAKAEREEFTL